MKVCTKCSHYDYSEGCICSWTKNSICSCYINDDEECNHQRVGRCVECEFDGVYDI